MYKITNDKSVCYGCPNEFEDKNLCSVKCKRREAYANDRPYEHLPFLIDIPEPTILLPETPNTDMLWKFDKKKTKTERCLICGREKSATNKIRRGICVSPCYDRWRKGKIEHPVEGKFTRLNTEGLKKARWGEYDKCLIDGCDNDGDRRDLCQKTHYKQWRTGKILHPVEGKFIAKKNRITRQPVEMREYIVDFRKYPKLLEKFLEIEKEGLLPWEHIVIKMLADNLSG